MDSLRKKVKELLESKAIDVMIGYGEDSDGTIRAIFVRKPEDADKLIYNERCVQNLAFYILKPELQKMGKMGVVAPLSVLRATLQVASENQVKWAQLAVLGVTPDGKLTHFTSFEEMAAYIKEQNLDLPAKEKEIIEKLDKMTPEERRKFWNAELSKCIKCYACRAACPMCYCGRCQVEYNKPQWITVEATPLGNLEWHFMRAMHLAGRCVSCGECGRACPMEIPIHLLTYKGVQTVKNAFDYYAGTSSKMPSVMSNYKPDDKENFIR